MISSTFVAFVIPFSLVISPRKIHYMSPAGGLFRKQNLRLGPDPRSDNTAFGAGTFSRQDPVYSWKAGPGEVIIVENLFHLFHIKPE
jgi:hypothetical protein